MKYFSYLNGWEKLLFGFSVLVDLFLVWGIVFKGVLGVGGIVLIYTAQQTLFTLMYKGLQKIPRPQLDDKLKKGLQSYESTKVLWSGLSLKASAAWWAISLIVNFIIAPWMQSRV